MEVDLDTLKRTVTIGEVLRTEGIDAPYRENYRVPCPIHGGANPNMAVTRDEVFFCYKCGAGGSVIDLVSKLHNISLAEAIDELATGRGIGYNPLKRGVRALYSRLEKMHEVSTPELDIPVLTELEEGYRGLSRETINHFELARCDDGVFIPNFDLNGKICGYAIRQPDGVQPKYKNNRGYDKSVPFGIFKDKSYIIEKGFAIVCEGQFDAIKLWDSGTRNVVAIGGSSFMESQAHLLLALTDNLTLMLDGDETGIQGMIKIMKRWASTFNLSPVFLNNGMDPCEWVESSRRLNDE